MLYIAATTNALLPVVENLMALTKQYTVFTFAGNLGAGKTTLIKNFCSHLGVQGNVSSPTFGLVNEYETENGKTIYHFDCYRLKSVEEAYDIGFEEYIDSNHICLIEWPEMVQQLLPQNSVKVTLNILPDNSRQVEIQTL